MQAISSIWRTLAFLPITLSYSTRSEVSTFLCSAQSPLRALISGGSQGPGEAKTESWLPPNLDISATLCHFTLCVPIPILSSPSPHLLLWLRPQWMAETEFFSSECDTMFPGSHLFGPMPHSCSVIFLKFLTCLKTLWRKALKLPRAHPPASSLSCFLQCFSISYLTQHYQLGHRLGLLWC